MPKTHELRKSDLCEEKSIMVEVQGQMHLRYISQKNPTHMKRNLLRRRRKTKCTWDAWVRKTWLAWKKKSTMMEIQDQICLRHVSQENPTYMIRNILKWRRKAKCAWNAWIGKIRPVWREIRYSKCARLNAPKTRVGKTQPIWSEIHYSRGARPNTLEMHELKKSDLLEEKFAMMEVQRWMCPRRVSYEA